VRVSRGVCLPSQRALVHVELRRSRPGPSSASSVTRGLRHHAHAARNNKSARRQSDVIVLITRRSRTRISADDANETRILRLIRVSSA